MTMRWIGAVVLFPLLISGGAYADGAGQVEAILKADEIDSCRVKVGTFAVVIHWERKRHPVSAKWKRLETDRGYIQALDWEKRVLTLATGEERQLKRIAMKRIQTLVKLQEPSVKGEPRITKYGAKSEREKVVLPSRRSTARDSTLVRPFQAQNAPDTTLVVKEKHRPSSDIGNFGLRLLAKVAAGTVWSSITGTAAYITIGPIKKEPEDRATHAIIDELLFFASVGWAVGFPLGVSWPDPHDSWPKTFLAGVIPAMAGYSLAMTSQEHGLEVELLVYVVPVVSSLIVSEVSRKPLKDCRLSFGLAPNPDSGLSAVAKLHF